MKRHRKSRRNEPFDLESELRSSRPQPRAEFVQALAEDVRQQVARSRSTWGRASLAIALTGLMLVAVASFGGVGYAHSAASEAAKKVQQVVRAKPAAHRRFVPTSVSSGQAQYGSAGTLQTPTAARPTTPTPTTTTPTTTTPTTTTPTTTAPTTPAKAPTPKGGSGVAGASKGLGGQGAAPGATQKPTSGLPFTGLALWMPLAGGLLLIAFGLALRTRGRRGNSSA
jgi:hypothetical protein